jgi:ubiquinone/menaquinone biosynthesis C-methylase UbiE
MSSYEAKRHYRGSVAANYVRARAADPKWRREQETMREVLARLPRGRLILDVPFGTGRFAEYYAAGGHRILGTDISRDMLAQSRAGDAVRALAPALVQADAERLPLRDGSVDYVVCSRLFNWIPAPVAATMLGEFRRVAREGIILGVRVGEPLPAPAFARQVVSTIVQAPQQSAIRVARATARRGRALATGLLDRVSPARAAGRPAPTYPKGYVVPRRADFDEMLRRQGVVADGVYPVHQVYDFRRLVNKELRFYRLRLS